MFFLQCTPYGYDYRKWAMLERTFLTKLKIIDVNSYIYEHGIYSRLCHGLQNWETRVSPMALCCIMVYWTIIKGKQMISKNFTCPLFRSKQWNFYPYTACQEIPVCFSQRFQVSSLLPFPPLGWCIWQRVAKLWHQVTSGHGFMTLFLNPFKVTTILKSKVGKTKA